jgi:hypothetical protein
MASGRCTMYATKLLAIITRINPAAWDAIFPQYGPGGPQGVWRASQAERVSLNPQPEPPGDAFVVGVAEMAHSVVRMAFESQVRGESAVAMVSRFADDWCGTPPWPWPWFGPWPWPGPPDPDPWTVQTGRVVVAAVYASTGFSMAKGELRTAFVNGAERLAEAATAETAETATSD